MARAVQRSRGRLRTSVWLEGRAREGRGSGQPWGLDRDRITEATVRMLDADGPAALSMRRLAAELNVTAMSLYWYVDTKDDLLELSLDRAFGELELPDPAADEDWRDQVRAMAREYRMLLVRHPWLSPLVGRFLNIGPHALAFSRVIHQVLCRTGLSAHGVSGAVSAVSQFVYGYGMIEGLFHVRVADTGMTPDAYHRHVMNEVAQSTNASEAIEESARIMEARAGDSVEDMLERDFVFALDLLIAGIDAMVARGRE